jgi:hypothetical protein
MPADNRTKVATGLNRVEWDHPHLGPVSETVCHFHELTVLGALHALGIGCGGQREWDPERTCHRCAHPNQRVRVWLSTVLAPAGPTLPH